MGIKGMKDERFKKKMWMKQSQKGEKQKGNSLGKLN